MSPVMSEQARAAAVPSGIDHLHVSLEGLHIKWMLPYIGSKWKYWYLPKEKFGL